MSTKNLLESITCTPQKSHKENSSFISEVSQETSFSLKTESSSSSSPLGLNKNSFQPGKQRNEIQRMRSFPPSIPKIILFPSSHTLRSFPFKRKMCLNSKKNHNGRTTQGNNVNNKFNHHLSNVYQKENKIIPSFQNTEILRLKIKTGKNEYKIFSVRKYDDIFINLKTFFLINNITNLNLIKPIAYKIFMALNNIFWVLNNTIQKEDRNYLLSLYHNSKNKGNFSKKKY